MRKPFVVIDAEILNSSIWSESAATRLVWFTLLILCDTEGYVGAAVPGLARQAGVTVTECETALATFLAPDPHSRTTAHGGRRIEAVERGWRVLNFEAALDRMSLERKKVRERVRKWRARRKAEAGGDSKADGNVTVRPGKRDKGPETREQGPTENGSSVPQPLSSEPDVDPRQSPKTGLTPEQETEYATAVVDAVSARRGSDMPLPSNLDGQEIQRWMEARIPLRIALRGIQDCSKAPPTIRYAGPAVREAYGQYRKALA